MSQLNIFKPVPSQQQIETRIYELIDRGALFVVSHSGGKDSQAMYEKLRRMVPASQLVVIHAELPGADWPGVTEYIRGQVVHPFYVVRAGKTFLEMVKHRQKWPDAQIRNCTSDLKRGPIQKQIRHILKERGLNIVVDCQGLRAEESTDREAKEIFSVDEKQSLTPRHYKNGNSTPGREWYVWLPIHDYSMERVWQTCGTSTADWKRRIALYKTGHKEAALDGWPCFWTYAAGMTRLSCMFCILASKSDLQTAAALRPNDLLTITETEKEIGHTFKMPRKGQKPQPLTEFIK